MVTEKKINKAKIEAQEMMKGLMKNVDCSDFSKKELHGLYVFCTGIIIGINNLTAK